MKSCINLLLLLVLNQTSYFVDYMEFEDLLGKHLSVIKKVIKSDFESVNYGTKFYKNKEYLINDYFGMTYNFITIRTNESDIVQTISIHFRKIINKQFYKLFVEEYGEPDSIQIIENRQLESESIKKNNNGKVIETLRKSTFDLREGSFEERPLYIIWKKERFKIKAFLRHEQNISEITFSIK